ncbi:MAG: hypothetical protein FJZ67_10020 [Bacteroidetes bacterium]|nr:hypothetical protein [Bacteroidota bacterium]
MNFYFISVENKKTNANLENLAYSLYLDSDLKLNQFTMIHFTPNSIPDTTWSKKKKNDVTYRNRKINCEFDLTEKLNSIFDNYRLIEKKTYTNYLLASSEYIENNKIEPHFKVREVNTSDGFSIQREINKIKEATGKNPCNIYCLSNTYQYSKPTFKFEKDTIIGKGQIEIKYSSSSKVSKIEWGSNSNLNSSNIDKPIVNIVSNQTIKSYYIDENGCKSNEDELTLIYKEDCNCNEINGKPEISYEKSQSNLFAKSENEEADYEYKAVSDFSGTYKYPFHLKKVCGESYNVSIKNKNGNVVYNENYLTNELDIIDGYLFLEIQFDQKNASLIGEINDPDSYYFVTITPIVNNELCYKRSFKTRSIRFSKCR